MPFDNEGICVEEVKTCSLCQQPGQVFYEGLRDRVFSVPGVWSLFKCGRCGWVWLNPQPVREDIGKLYSEYFTHAQETSSVSSLPVRTDWRYKMKMSVLATHFGYSNALPSPGWECIGKVGGFLPFLRDWAAGLVMYLPAAARGRLLDIGCGNGTFLASMRERGWEVLGVEPDPEASRLARERYGLEVVTDTLEGAALPVSSADAITLNHVIEHVPDPVALLEECCRLLQPGGKLVAVTPNVESLGHRLFGARWPHLDPPRHLHLFSQRTLQACAEKAGLRTESLRGRVAFNSWAFLALQHALRLLDRKAGEELVLVATRLT